MEKSPEGTESKGVKAIIVPVAMSAILGPGAGQLYHRHWKKGILLIVISFALLIAMGFFLVKAAQTELHLLESSSDPNVLMEGGFEMALAQSIVKKYSKGLYAFKWSFIALWCYSIVDAFLVAKKKVDAA